MLLMLISLKKHILCDRKTALLFFVLAMFACGLPLLPAAAQIWFEANKLSLPGEPGQLFSVAQSLYWLGLLVIFCFDIQKRNFGRSFSSAAGYVAGNVAICLFLLFGPVLEDYCQRTRFDSTAWKAGEGSVHKPTHLRMVDDLLHRYRLQGMPRQEIENLLGKPPETDYFHDYDYVYWLGPERGFISLDSEWLCIKFENNVVTRADIRRD
jgi:hypothetical protein